MITVTGRFRGQPYAITLGNRLPDGPSWGQATGSAHVLALLASREGTDVRVTSRGRTMRVDRTDIASLLGALYALTTVVSVESQAAQLAERTRA